MKDCCQQDYGNSSVESMNIIKHMSDNNQDTEIAEPGDEKIRDFGEEMSHPLEIGKYKPNNLFNRQRI